MPAVKKIGLSDFLRKKRADAKNTKETKTRKKMKNTTDEQ